jgi:peptidoglycan/LPS O-acetylase OafA/YrhL
MHRNYGLDFARLLAAYSVALGHLAFGGTFAVDAVFQQWTLKGESLPLLLKNEQNLWVLDYFLLTKLHTATGIIGVGLFFVISGYVVPPMLSKYTKYQFIINRILRIYPILIFSVFLAALIQYCYGDRQSLGFVAVLSTAGLVNDITHYPYTLGVVWTLVIEFKFYILLAIFGAPTNFKIYIITLVFFALCAAYYCIEYIGINEMPLTNFIANGIIRDLHYIVFMLVSTSFYVSIRDDNKHSRIFRFRHCFIMLVAFNIARIIVVDVLKIQLWQDINPISQIIIFLIFWSCLEFQKIIIRKNTIKKIIAQTSNVTYSLYLLHLSTGIFLLSVLRNFISNQYLLVFLVMLIITALSLACFHGIEKKFRYRNIT